MTAVDRQTYDRAVRAAAAQLEAEQASACLLGEHGEILAVNGAWDRFARDNGGSPGCLGRELVGQTYFNFIEGLGPRSFFEGVWLRVLAGLPVRVDGDCSSPGQPRDLSSQFLPVRLGNVRGAAILHSTTARASAGTSAPRLSDYAGTDGTLTSCTSCGRVLRRDGRSWDFLVALPFRRGAGPDTWCPTCGVILSLSAAPLRELR